MKLPATTAKERADFIYDELRSRICFLTYPPGTRLKEGDLAEEFGVSRTPLRKALASLEAHGYVEVHHGFGNIVSEIRPQEALQIYEVRRELAMLMATMSPTQDLQSIVEAIEPLIEQCKCLCHKPDVMEFARVDAAFFLALCRMTENRALREIAEILYFRTARIWVHSIPAMNLAREIGEVLAEMEQIHAALLHGDLNAVGHIRWLHISKCFFFRPNEVEVQSLAPG